MDISDTAGLAALQKLSDPAQYSSCTPLQVDSWVPSISQNPVVVTCKKSPSIDSSTCSASADFRTSSNACGAGCYDTYDMFKGNASKATVDAETTVRYSGGTCTAFTDDLGNIWTNFYKKKVDDIGAANGRSTTAQGSIATVVTDIQVDIVGTFNSVTTALNNLVSSITHPQFGMIAGLNCKLLGEDIVRVIDVTCLELFNNFYFSRLVIGIASFGILFSLCCSVCAGVRYFKHSERKDKILGNTGDFGATNENLKFR